MPKGKYSKPKSKPKKTKRKWPQIKNGRKPAKSKGVYGARS